jgi:polyferredoxin
VLKTIWLLDAEPSAAVMKGPALRVRSRQIRWLRHAVQTLFAAVLAWIGIDFVRWVHAIERGDVSLPRPAGVEAFLPISGLVSLRHLWLTGEVHPVHPAALVILVAVIAASLLLKKAFCAWVCPVGTLSEMLAAVHEWTFGRRLRLPRWLDVPLRGVKYLLLLFFVYAIFLSMTPEALAAFLASPYNQVADVKMLDFFARPSPLTVKVLFALVLLSVMIPYAWCRYLCPYGALVGVVSLVSPLKVTRDAQTCIDCGLCTKACPSNLPVERLARVRSDECIGCLSCVAACPVTRALRVEAPGPRPFAVRPAVFALVLLATFAVAIGGAKLLGFWTSSVTNAEFLERVRERHSPQYVHPR